MITVDYIHRFITSMGFTITIETLILYFCLRYALKNQESIKKIVLTGFFASFATIPYVWFVFPYLLKWSRDTSLMFSEPFVFIVEAIFYRTFLKTGWGSSFLLSLVCNLASYILGPILRSNGLWIYW